MAVVVPTEWQFELLECNIPHGNLSMKTCENRTAECQECSIYQMYNQPNMAAVEAAGTTLCFPGVTGTNKSAEVFMDLEGRYGKGHFHYAEVWPYF